MIHKAGEQKAIRENAEARFTPIPKARMITTGVTDAAAAKRQRRKSWGKGKCQRSLAEVKEKIQQPAPSNYQTRRALNSHALIPFAIGGGEKKIESGSNRGKKRDQFDMGRAEEKKGGSETIYITHLKATSKKEIAITREGEE